MIHGNHKRCGNNKLFFDLMASATIEKLETLLTVMGKYDASKETTAYFGDDVPDIPCMRQCGIVGCPGDAVESVKQISNYICKSNAGYGAAREFIEWLLQK